MKQSILNKWVRALRGGRYKKTCNMLKTPTDEGKERHCFLGVLCDLHSKETGTEWDEDGRYLGEGGSLPEAVRKWAGLNDHDPKIYEEHGSDRCGVECNDEMNFSFKKMASLLVEAQKKGWLGKIIKQRKKITKKKEIVYGGRLGTGITGELEHEQPEESAQVRT